MHDLLFSSSTLAKHNYTKLVTDHDIQVQSFQGYGSNFIKKSGFSPDAYVQMAMQLATYRLWGEQVRPGKLVLLYAPMCS